jgi:hypothetical protein
MWYANQGFNENLLVQLTGGSAMYLLDVYVVARFRFFYSEGAANWTIPEIDDWKGRFATLVRSTWSTQWTLRSDISCDPIDVDRGAILMPMATVQVHVVDEEAPTVTLPSRQRLYAINVYRRAPDEARGREHAASLETSRTTVGDSGAGELPATTPRAQLYEDSLEPGEPSSVDGTTQVTAMHEFGHLLGLMHPNDMTPGCIMDRSASICYGQAYSPESRSIMGRGQEVRPDEYRVFAHIMSRLVREVPSAGLLGWIGMSTSLHWFVTGGADDFCDGSYGRLAASRPRSDFTRGRGRGRRPGPTDIA